MKLAITSAVAFDGLRTPYQPTPELRARLAWWAARGAEGIVLYDTLPHFYNLADGEIEALRAAVEDAGLVIPAFNALRKSLHDPALAASDSDRLNYCMAAASAAGATVLDVSVCAPLAAGRAATGWEPHALYHGADASQETVTTVADRLRAVARACARTGMRLAIELHDDGIHDTAQRCLDLLHRIGESNVGVNPDLGNWYRMPDELGQSWQEELRLLAPHTVYWEVKNYQRIVLPELGRAVALPAEIDAGDIDFRAAAIMLRRAGFDGWVCNEGGHGDRVTSTVRYLAYFRWILDDWDGVSGG